MRRWLMLLLLVVLPLQFTWTAAAVYCQNEVTRDVTTVERHFGHHEHEHDAATDVPAVEARAVSDPAVASNDASTVATGDESTVATSDPSTVDGSLSVDNDCGYCQLNAAKQVQSGPATVAARIVTSIFMAAIPPWQTRDPDRLEKPDWRLA